MIELNKVYKSFEDKEALKNIDLQFCEGRIYGLVGTNGSGKSTMLRLISGVYKEDGGSCKLDNEEVFGNNLAKEKVFFISDDLYFMPQATLESMAKVYRAAYPNWSEERYKKLCTLFPIGQKKKLSTFSKGMRRQAAFILALSTCPKYLLLDEAFDGIDPVIRHAVRELISDIIAEDSICCIISSHNLRELEDFCDEICLIHDGELKLTGETFRLSSSYCKVQMALSEIPEEFNLNGIEILSKKVTGSLVTLILKANEDEALREVEKLEPIFSEAIPLTLEELFIYEMEAVGYDYSNIIF